MIKHIVMFRFSDLEGKEEKLEALKNMMEDLKTKIPEVVHLEAGLNFSTRETAYDIVLISDFRSVEDLEIYRVHPEHVKVVEFIKAGDANYDVAVVDYEY